MCVLCAFGTFSHLVVLSEGAVHLASQGHHSFALETPQTKHHRFNHKEVFYVSVSTACSIKVFLRSFADNLDSGKNWVIKSHCVKTISKISS